MPKTFLCFALLACAALAHATDLPSGWQSRREDNATVFTPENGSGKTFLLMAFDPLPAGGFAANAWLPVMAAELSAGYGSVLDKGQVEGSAEVATLAQRLEVAGKPVRAVYTAFPRADGQMQLLLLLSEEDAALFAAHQAQSQTIMAALYAQAHGNKVESAKATPAEKGEWRTAPDRGVKPGDIEALLYHGELEYWGTDLQFVERQTLLLRDGSAYTNLTLPPADLDVAASRQHDPEHWTRWRKQGEGYQIEEKGHWRAAEGSAVRGGKAGETLNGTYTYSAAYGTVYSGGSAYFHHLTFYPDGRYSDSDYSIAGQSNVNTSITVSPHGTTASVATGNGSVHLADTGKALPDADKGGRYQLDGHTLILTRADGSRERLLFFFWAGDKNLSIGGKTYAREDN